MLNCIVIMPSAGSSRYGRRQVGDERKGLFNSMGKNSVQFKCHHCNHCCTEVVCLPTPWDVIQIVRATRLNPYQFLDFLGPEEIDEVPKNDPTWLKVNGRRYIMALRREKLGCYFLDKSSRYCTIYNSRPILCRLYPFKLQETRDGRFRGFTLHNDVGCPRHRDGQVPTKPLYDLYLEDSKHQDDYGDLVAVFNRRQYAGKKPEDFIELFISGFGPHHSPVPGGETPYRRATRGRKHMSEQDILEGGRPENRQGT